MLQLDDKKSIDLPQLKYSDLSKEKIELLKNTVCKGANDNELQLFLHVCQRTGLDPFMKQIYSIARGGQRTIQTGIDGLRLIADRSKNYAPGKESTYQYNEKKELLSSTSYVKKKTDDGVWHEVSATAFFSEYNPGNNPIWKKMPHVMLAKCAEAAALRKAFPGDLSGIYASEEMDQASTPNEAIEIIDPEKEKKMIEEFLGGFQEHEKNEALECLKSIAKRQNWTIPQSIQQVSMNLPRFLELLDSSKQKKTAES